LFLSGEVYAWFAVCDTRTLIMAILITVWASRLTYNFHRRGGYSWPPWRGEEDYRWKILQNGTLFSFLTNKYLWIVFNLVFISIFQIFLLMLITTPSLVAWSAATLDCQQSVYRPFQMLGLDGVASLLILFWILIESIADNQQYEFQTEKYRLRATNDESLLVHDYKDGFYHSSGLFKLVRKPNYMAEQAIWISYYLFSLSATSFQSLLNWSALGFFLLCLLFQGSSYLTEMITEGKYPKYRDYKNEVPLFVPSIFSLFRIAFGKMKKKEN